MTSTSNSDVYSDLVKAHLRLIENSLDDAEQGDDKAQQAIWASMKAVEQNEHKARILGFKGCITGERCDPGIIYTCRHCAGEQTFLGRSIAGRQRREVSREVQDREPRARGSSLVNQREAR